MSKKYDAGVGYRDTHSTPITFLDTDLPAASNASARTAFPRRKSPLLWLPNPPPAPGPLVVRALTDLDFYKGRCYRIEDVPGDKESSAFIAYLDLFEEGSINVLTLVGNAFACLPPPPFKTSASRWRSSRAATACRTASRPSATGRTSTAVPLGCTNKPKLGPSGKNYGRVVYERLRGGLDHQGRREHQLPALQVGRTASSSLRATKLSEQETGERKGHYLNVTANTPRRCAAPSSPRNSACRSSCTIITVVTANTGLSKWCRKNGRCCTFTAPCTR